MTKARAKARAKDNALKKAKKRIATAKQRELESQSEHFTPEAQSLKQPHTNTPGNSFSAGKRGSARSK